MPTATTRTIFWALLLFFACFFVWPIISTVKTAFTGVHGGFTLSYITEVFANDLYRRGLANSLNMAVFTTLGCLLVAIPLASIYVKCDFPGKTILNSLVLTPMILPPFVGAIGIKAILGQAGALNSLLISLHLMDPQHPMDWLGSGQMTGIVIMNVLHLYPILYLNVSAALSNLDPALEEAAANLGCAPQDRFRRITLPLTLPGVAAGAVFVFVLSIGNFVTPALLGGGRFQMIGNLVYDQFLAANDWPFGAALAMALIAIMMLLLMLQAFAATRAEGRQAPEREEAAHG